MPSADGSFIRPRPVIGAMLLATLACLPLGWAHLAPVGGFDLTLPYFATLGLGGALLMQAARTGVALRDMASRCAPWLLLYAVYLCLLGLNVAGLPSKGIVLRQVFFMSCGLTVACAILVIGADRRFLRLGGLAAILGFVATTEVLSWQLGLSWITAAERFFLRGDLDFVVYDFLRSVFALAQPEAAEVPAAFKNAAAAALLIALVVFRASGPVGARDRWGTVVTVLTLIVLLLLNTRSVLVVVLAALPAVAAIGAIRAPRPTPEALVLKTALVAAGLAAAALLLWNGTAATSVLEERFAFSDPSTGGRLHLNAAALAGIERNPLTGNGLVETDGHLVHNLFLGAWLHAGLAAFLLVSSVYLMILIGWAHFVFRAMAQRGFWVLPLRVEWIAVLPILPLFRVWIAGDAGHPGFPEWIALAVFFAFAVANARARSALSRPTPAVGGLRPA